MSQIKVYIDPDPDQPVIAPYTGATIFKTTHVYCPYKVWWKTNIAPVDHHS